MGLVRLMWRATGVGLVIDTVKNSIEEGSVIDGIKKINKEYWCEDNLIGKVIYDTGHYDGRKEGYSDASNEFQLKLLKQADDFIDQKRDFQNEKEEYEKLLDEYETEIENLTAKLNRSQMENEYLRELLIRMRKLNKLAK